jgi:hypothetical protein
MADVQALTGGPTAQDPLLTAQQQREQHIKAKHAKKPKRKVLTSLILQMLIVFGSLWFAFYYVFNIATFIYKGPSA